MMQSKAIRLGVALAALAAAACKSSNPASSSGADTPSAPAQPAAATARAPLLDTSAHEVAPAVFKARFETTKGAFTVEARREWAPLGVDRFYHLVKIGYFEEIAFFRCIKGFMVQFGVHGDPKVSAAWRAARIADDPSGKQSNTRGMLTFATSGANSRTNQLFINYADNVNLDSMGFAPIGRVVEGMDVVDALEGKYGEGAPGGAGPNQGRLNMEGNAYLRTEFPALDYIKKATLLP